MVGAALRRYLLFGGAWYYPCGGWRDFQGSFDTLEEAEARGRLGRKIPGDVGGGCDAFGWWHIVDQESGKIVSEGDADL